MKNTSNRKTRVRRHPQPLIDQLLDWCAQNATERADAVLDIGLVLGHGLNEHMIAAATIRSVESPIVLGVPMARRAGAIAKAERRPLRLSEPDWLIAAATVVIGRDHPVPRLLHRPYRRTGTVGPASIRALVTNAAEEATGVRMTISTLVSTRTASLGEQQLPFGLFDLGWAPSWVARLLDPRPQLIPPRRRAA